MITRSILLIVSGSNFFARQLVGFIGLFCIGLSACMAGAAPAATGVGIFDTLFIGKNVSLGVNGGLYLKEAHVLGEGMLVFNGEGPIADGIKRAGEVLTFDATGHLKKFDKGNNFTLPSTYTLHALTGIYM